MKVNLNLSQAVVCPKCKGRRVVFNPESLLLTFALPVALLIDHDEDDGITKKTCPTCKGKGWLER